MHGHDVSEYIKTQIPQYFNMYKHWSKDINDSLIFSNDGIIEIDYGVASGNTSD